MTPNGETPTVEVGETNALAVSGRPCPYCGGPNPFWDDLDPRSWECTACLAEAHGGPENPGWLM